MSPFILTFLALTVGASASAIPYGTNLQPRAVGQGWSLQSQQCPANARTCGSASCCPTSTNCQQTGNGEVYACCPTTSNCRGAVEGNPTCADSSWSLWKGNYGNGFCCDTSLIGAYIGGGSSAGTCVTAVPAGQTSAILMSRGSGVGTPSTTSRSVPTTTGGSGSSPTPTGKSGKPVFMHYMIGGISEEHCKQDLADASRLGIDAFALNYDDTGFQGWSTGTVNNLFNNAVNNNMKLFFSFDFNYFKDPNTFQSFLKPYLSHPAYFKYNGKPLVSTFGGKEVSDSSWNSFKGSLGTDIVLVPSVFNQGPEDQFFNSHSSWDGLFNWESWPWEGTGKVSVSSANDQTWQTMSKNANKLFMMGMSPLQFKHISGQSWYRRGEGNLENRIGQVLALQPDMLEIQTWNDAGESHYMGNSWPEPIGGAPQISAYTKDYLHQGYWEILPAFVQAWKRGDTDTSKMVPTNGKAAQGVFWHHTLLVNADCSSDGMGKPKGVTSDAEDLVTGIILVAPGQNGLVVTATSGTTQVGTQQLKPGYNKFAFGGLSTGTVSVQVANGNNVVIRRAGNIPVSNSASLCNYNFQVVGLGS